MPPTAVMHRLHKIRFIHRPRNVAQYRANTSAGKTSMGQDCGLQGQE
jgi:hypothetical protein